MPTQKRIRAAKQHRLDIQSFRASPLDQKMIEQAYEVLIRAMVRLALVTTVKHKHITSEKK